MLKIQDIPYKLPVFFSMDSTELADFSLVADNIEFIGKSIFLEDKPHIYAIYKYENGYDYKFMVFSPLGPIDWGVIKDVNSEDNIVICLYSQRWCRSSNEMKVYRHLKNHSELLEWFTGEKYIVSSLYQYMCDIYGIRCDSEVIHIDELEQQRYIRESQGSKNYIKFDPISGDGGIHSLIDRNIQIMNKNPLMFVNIYGNRVIDNTAWTRTVIKNSRYESKVKISSSMFKFINAISHIPIQNACIYYYFEENTNVVIHKIENISFWSGFCDNNNINELGRLLWNYHKESGNTHCNEIKLQYLNEEIKLTKYSNGKEISSFYILVPMAELINPILHIRLNYR